MLSVRGAASGPIATHVTMRPSSSQVPSTRTPPGARRAAIRCHAARTSLSSYWRRTFIARMTAGRRPSGDRHLEPAERERHARIRRERRAAGAHVVELCAGARDASRIDLEAEHLDIRRARGRGARAARAPSRRSRRSRDRPRAGRSRGAVRDAGRSSGRLVGGDSCRSCRGSPVRRASDRRP